MPKEKPHQSQGLIWGGDTPTIPQDTYSSKIPAEIIGRLEQEVQGIDFGGVSLIVTVRDGRKNYRIEKTVSMLTGI